MQEIGSEFLLDDINISTTVKSIDNCIFLENGRQCFKVVADKVDGQILFPAYACESMIQNINPNRIIYYDVDKDFNIDFNSISQEIISKISIFVFVDYYGFPQSVENIIKINALKNKGVLVVEDITHSVFSEFDFIGDVLIDRKSVV